MIGSCHTHTHLHFALHCTTTNLWMMRHFEFVHTFMKESFGRTYGKRLVGSFAKGTKQDSEPATSVRGSQPIEPNASHLRETLVIGVQVIAQIS